MSLHQKVVSSYRRIFRIAKEWPVEEESKYMRLEARRLFRANQALTEIPRIEQKLVEAEQRIELCIHYRNPYPRWMNAINVSGEQIRDGAALRGVMPGYLSSYYDPSATDSSSGPATRAALQEEEKDDRSF